MLENAHNMADIIIANSFVQSFPKASTAPETQYELKIFNDLLRSIVMSNDSIACVDIFYSGLNTIIASDFGTTSYLNDNAIAWFKSLAEMNMPALYTSQYRKNLDLFYARSSNHITLLRPLYQFNTGEKLGIVAVSIESRAIQNILKGSEGAYTVIIDSNDQVLVSGNPEEEITEEGILIYPFRNDHQGFISTKDGQSYFTAFSELPQTGWILASFAPADKLIKSGKRIRDYLILIIAMNLAVILAAIVIEWKKVIKRLDTLIGLMSRVQGGDLEIKYEDAGNDEITFIFTSFNTMVARLNRLFTENYQLKLLHKDVQLKFMQNQINPHFIYNIFDNMGWMLELKRYNELESLVEAVATYYRKSLNNGETLISVNDMTESIESYLRIQKMRFSDRLDYELTFDPDLKQVRILNHLLLPLVENAVCHGAEQSLRKCTIWITGRISGYGIILQVADNGAGIAPERFRSLCEALEKPNAHGSGYFAMDNVNQRIKLYYGQEFGLKLQSEPEQGTTVTVNLPFPVQLGRQED
jgi:two-component system sensor histidine kinase YesM